MGQLIEAVNDAKAHRNRFAKALGYLKKKILLSLGPSHSHCENLLDKEMVRIAAKIRKYLPIKRHYEEYQKFQHNQPPTKGPSVFCNNT